MYELRIINSNNEEVFSFTGTSAQLEMIALEMTASIGDTIMMIDAETGEVLDDYTVHTEADLCNLCIEDEECDFEPDDSMLECGYDPYMGCYSDDC